MFFCRSRSREHRRHRSRSMSRERKRRTRSKSREKRHRHRSRSSSRSRSRSHQRSGHSSRDRSRERSRRRYWGVRKRIWNSLYALELKYFWFETQSSNMYTFVCGWITFFPLMDYMGSSERIYLWARVEIEQVCAEVLAFLCLVYLGKKEYFMGK